MKTKLTNNFFLYLFFIISFILVSCQQDQGIAISAKIQGNNITPNLSNNQSVYIPLTMIEYLTDNSLLQLGVKAPGKNLITTDIDNFKKFGVDNGLVFEFITSLEAGKNRLLFLRLGDKNFKEETSDANTEFLFIDSMFTDIQDGLSINMELKPIFKFSGDIIIDNPNSNSNSLGENIKLKVYPSILDEEGDYSSIFNFDVKDANFDFYSIYSRFKAKDRLSPYSSNVIITAKQGNKIGFTLISKEYFNLKSKENILVENKEFGEAIVNEKKCYDSYSMYYKGNEEILKSDCQSINSICLFNENMDNLTEDDKSNMKSCFFTQSGNLLPGVKLENDIKIYEKSDLGELLRTNKYLVSSVSSPKFAKNMSVFEDLDYPTDTYYGNFFITGFNLPQVFSDISILYPEINDATIRIYYDVPEKIKEIFVKEGENSSKTYYATYLEYKGPFSLYKVAQRISDLTEKTDELWVLQNRLPFFNIYVSYADNQTGDTVNYPISTFLDGTENSINKYLELSDGSAEKTFLGIIGLEKQISSSKVLRVEFNQSIDSSDKDFENNFEEIYPNAK